MITTTHTDRRVPRTGGRRFAAILTTLALAVSGIAFGATSAQAATESLTATSLRTNGLTNPLGIAASAPTLSWKTTSNGRAITQTGYEVRVSTNPTDQSTDDVWSSGAVTSSDQLNIAYAGTALASQTRYYWQVRVTDNNGVQSGWSATARFETGLTASGDWNANWIGAPNPVDQWTDYTVTTKFTMDKNALGVFVRATSTANAYMWQLNISDGTPRLRPHVRVNGGYTLLDSKDISAYTSVAALQTGVHTMAITLSGSTITTVLDGVQIDQRTNTQWSKGYVGFRQDNDAGFGNEQATIHSMNVTAATGAVLLDTDLTTATVNPFSGGTLTSNGLVVVGPNNDVIYTPTSSQPLLRKSFDTGSKTITSARVYASAQGVYQLDINGTKVGDDQLAPGWTDYTKRIEYQTYDVTDLVKSGANAIGAEIGDGWYSGHIASFGADHYGNTPSLIAQLRIDYLDGSHQWVKTDGTWKTTAGPFVQTDIINGETYDARLVPAGWQNATFDDSTWANAATGTSAPTALLEPQSDQPVQVTEKRTPISVKESAPGVYIYDMGQNMVGVAQMDLTGTAGSTAKIRYGEVLNPDGTLYTANLRSAKATDYYTFATDGTASYTPTFTYHGYRYLEVSGVTAKPTVDQITGLVWGSNLPVTGSLTSSSTLLNQLQSNITWGQRGNFLSIPTDTPARDERLGWTGDINVFSPTASYNMDTLTFLGKWLNDLSDAQSANGDLPGIAPQGPGVSVGVGGTGWADAGITVTYALWHAYGTTDSVSDHYAMMKKYMDYVESGISSTTGLRDVNTYADWLNLDDPTGGSLLSTAYLAYTSRLMSEMATAIGKTADATHYAQVESDATTAFQKAFIATDGTVSGNSEAGYAMALGMGLVPADQVQAVGDKYVAKIAAENNHLSTGFLGTPWLLPALSVSGHQDLAYKLINTTTYPSWGYEVASGATTMWERWNSIMPDGSFGDVNMNSFNHYAYGAVGDWMYQNIGGIAATSAGYKTFTIAPKPGGGITHGDGEFDSVYGQISSKWTTTDTGISLDAAVPVNSTATVSLPAVTLKQLTEGGHPLDQVAGVSHITLTDGTATFTVGSGDYSFSSDLANVGFAAQIVSGGDVTAGDTAAGIVRVTNPGSTPLKGFAAVLTLPDGLEAKPSVVSADAIAAGATVDLPFSVKIPADYPAGTVNVSAAVSAIVNGSVSSYSVSADLASVTSAVSVATPTVSVPTGDAPQVATVTAVVSNSASSSITGHLVVDSPDGWPTPLPSSAITVPANGSATATVTVAVPTARTAGDVAITARFVAGDSTLASKAGTITTTLATPPAAGDTEDHVDLGESTSENSHNVTASPTSGTTTEAGLTRRYSGLTAGSWFTFDMNVTPNEPFVLRAIETFDKAQVKTYDIYVKQTGTTGDGTKIVSRAYPFTNPNGGLATYQVVVPDASLTTTGKVTVKMEYNGLGSYDPSIADAWTLSVPADTVAPSVSLDVSHQGSGGYYRAGAAATLTAADAGSGVDSIEYQLGAETTWHTYSAPIVLDEGTTAITYRATDADGNVSEPKTEQVKVDATKPTAEGWLSTSGKLVVLAQDAASGLDHVEYSVDGGTWFDSLSDFVAAHPAATSVKVRAIDKAGNTGDAVSLAPAATPSPVDLVAGSSALTEASGYTPGADVALSLKSSALSLGSATADDQGVVSTTSMIPAGTSATSDTVVYALANTIAPTVTGSFEAGQTLTATRGSWTAATGLTFTYQWTANGSAIDGATSVTFAVPTTLLGQPIGVTVVATAADAVASTSASSTASTVTLGGSSSVTNTSSPMLGGTGVVGSALTVSNGSWNIDSNGLAFSYRWLSNGTPIAGATSSSFTIPTSLLGTSIGAVVTAKVTGGTATGSAASALVTAIAANGSSTVVNTTAPALVGSAIVGTTVTAGTGAWNVGDGDLAFSYQWTADGMAIPGATAKSFTVPASALGKALGVTVTAKLGSTATSASSATRDVTASSKTAITLKKSTVKTSAHASVTVKVTTAGTSKPTGTVVLTYGKKTITKSLSTSSKGKLTISLPKLKKGSYSIKATYKGSTAILSSKSSTKKLTVKK